MLTVGNGAEGWRGQVVYGELGPFRKSWDAADRLCGCLILVTDSTSRPRAVQSRYISSVRGSLGTWHLDQHRKGTAMTGMNHTYTDAYTASHQYLTLSLSLSRSRSPCASLSPSLSHPLPHPLSRSPPLLRALCTSSTSRRLNTSPYPDPYPPPPLPPRTVLGVSLPSISRFFRRTSSSARCRSADSRVCRSVLAFGGEGAGPG